MSPAIDSATLLRPGLLQGVSLLVAQAPPPADGLANALGAGARQLGALLCTCEPDAADERAMDEAVSAVLAEAGRIDVLAVDGAGLFAQALASEGDGIERDGHAALRACVDAAWNVTRAVVNHALLPSRRPGRIVDLAPAPDAGGCAQAARAGLENLARTLSVEWARRQINVVAICPGTDTAAGEVAALVAYLASPAGAYFSGCVLDLHSV
jgi:NAD(P)-dependent dehydrogenase (short-subunit alcohol dehydrogenase family)